MVLRRLSSSVFQIVFDPTYFCYHLLMVETHFTVCTSLNCPHVHEYTQHTFSAPHPPCLSLSFLCPLVLFFSSIHSVSEATSEYWLGIKLLSSLPLTSPPMSFL